MKQSLIHQLDSLTSESYMQEMESIFDDESSSLSTSATSLNIQDSKSFQMVTNNMLAAGNHATLVLDCLNDMLRCENDLLEKELASLTEDLMKSVPMNSYKCKVFPMAPYVGPKR